jgi:hypothetical protein
MKPFFVKKNKQKNKKKTQSHTNFYGTLLADLVSEHTRGNQSPNVHFYSHLKQHDNDYPCMSLSDLYFDGQMSI